MLDNCKPRLFTTRRTAFLLYRVSSSEPSKANKFRSLSNYNFSWYTLTNTCHCLLQSDNLLSIMWPAIFFYAHQINIKFVWLYWKKCLEYGALILNIAGYFTVGAVVNGSKSKFSIQLNTYLPSGAAYYIFIIAHLSLFVLFPLDLKV